MLRGEIWYGVWPNDPNKKPRPLLIVSNNHRNRARFIRDVIVVKLTSLKKSDGSDKLTNSAEDLIVSLRKSTIIRCGSIYAVEKRFLTKKINQLSLQQMNDIDLKLKTVMDLR